MADASQEKCIYIISSVKAWSLSKVVDMNYVDMNVWRLGPGLAFIAYPRAVAMMPLPQLWAAFFFIMIIFLGVDSEFVILEGLVTSISDLYPAFFLTGHRRKFLLLFICVLSFFIGLTMITQGGLYVFLLFDYYACSGIPIMLFAILESICVGWIFESDSDQKTQKISGFSSPGFSTNMCEIM